MPVTLLPDGISNANIGSLGSAFPAPDPTRVFSVFDDFYFLDAATVAVAADYRALGSTPLAPTVNPAAAPAGTFGRALFAPAGATDTTFIQPTGNPTAAAGSLPLPFSFVPGRDVWFQTLFQISDANLSTICAGLLPSVAAAGDPLAAADGVFFTKASGTTTLSLRAIRTGVGNTTTAIATLVSATDIKVGYWYSAAKQALFAFVNDVQVASLAITNLPLVGLTPLIGHGNNTAARTSSWDFLFAAQARQAESGN